MVKGKRTTKGKAKAKRKVKSDETKKREIVRKLVKQLDRVDAVGTMMSHIADFERALNDPKEIAERRLPTNSEQLGVVRGVHFRRLKALCTYHGLKLVKVLEAETGYSTTEEAVEEAIKTFEATCASLGVRLRKLPVSTKWYRFSL